MIETMVAENGVGLAANQIGVSLSVFVLNIGGVKEVFVNPEILSMEEGIPYEEGCLSIPGVKATTSRYNKLRVAAFKIDSLGVFTRVEEDCEGLKAVAIQHEMDHLNGKLYIDQFGPLKKEMVVSKHNKFLRMTGSK